MHFEKIGKQIKMEYKKSRKHRLRYSERLLHKEKKMSTYIESVKSNDIPWHRLTTVYKRATDFPKFLDILSKMESIEEVGEAGAEIEINIEHQSTLWHSTPFALIFLLRIFKSALDKGRDNKVALYLSEQLLELFTNIALAVRGIEGLEHPDPLPNFSDMLKEEYLWSEEYDEEEDEMRYEDGEVFSADLFYSFYYYSYQVLLFSKPLLKQLDNKKANELYDLLQGLKIR